MYDAADMRPVQQAQRLVATRRALSAIHGKRMIVPQKKMDASEANRQNGQSNVQIKHELLEVGRPVPDDLLGQNKSRRNNCFMHFLPEILAEKSVFEADNQRPSKAEDECVSCL